jgi:precorrin-6B methylase 2
MLALLGYFNIFNNIKIGAKTLTLTIKALNLMRGKIIMSIESNKELVRLSYEAIQQENYDELNFFNFITIILKLY